MCTLEVYNTMRYVGENCPYCGVTFDQGDDIVVCPECATPHHRVCWFAHGDCANAERHGTDFVWKKAVEAPPEEEPAQPHISQRDAANLNIICPDCGTVSPKGTIRCPECGAMLIPFANPMGDPPLAQFKPGFNSTEDIRGIKSGDIALYCRSAGASYIKKFRRKVSWNWAAFLCAPFWFFYRKLHKAGAIFLTIHIALHLILIPAVTNFYNSSAPIMAEIAEIMAPYADENANSGGLMGVYLGGTSLSDEAYQEATDALNEFAQNNTQRIIDEIFKPMIPIYLIGFLLVALRVLSALLANKIYFKKICTDIREIRTSTSNERELQLKILSHGGTNIFFGIGTYFLFNLLINAASAFIMR